MNAHKQTMFLTMCCVAFLVFLNQDSTALAQQNAKVGSEDLPVQTWIDQLGHSRFTKRAEAAKELQQIGLKAIPLLCEALENSDPEVVDRASAVLEIVLQTTSKRNFNSLPMGVLENLATGRLSNLSALAMTILAEQKDKSQKAKALLTKLSKSSDEKLAAMALDVLDPMPTHPTARIYWERRLRMKASLKSYKKELAALQDKNDTKSRLRRSQLESLIRSNERSIQAYTRLIDRYRNRPTPNLRGRILRRGVPAPAVQRIQIRIKN
ncbi:MAG: hypothetical protein ACFCD0_09460 [Gemmataceae bacterium]